MDVVASFYVENFGCRATQADGAAIEEQFRGRGLERARRPGLAEVVVLNTCTVTGSADQDARSAIRRIHRENPNCQIVVTGCYAQRAPEEIAALPGVSKIIGNSHKHRLVEIVFAEPGLDSHFVPLATLAQGSARPTFVSDIFAHTELLAAPVFEASNERTRPNLKVQDGCDNRCSFCVIPYVRGRSRSLPLAEVLREVNALVASGYREVVISGINLGRWGRDLRAGEPSAGKPARASTSAQTRLPELVEAILGESRLEKLRISSVEPMDWSRELIGLMAESPRIAKHAHVPLQSGSDRILRQMHRKYRPWHYREKIEEIRAAMPMAAIGADVMVGFPGESEADFRATRSMIEELPFTYLHVFTYSPRPGTPAATSPQQVAVARARERNRLLRDIAGQKRRAFVESFVGRTVEAITLHGSREGSAEALTDNYLKLRLTSGGAANRWIRARVERVENDLLIGRELGQAAG
jgi:threonylcarbamoyladenosine tRNA methylthiotransferase MtaB